MIRFTLFLFFVAGWVLAASAIYVVRTPSGVAILPKDKLTFVDTYADTRGWKEGDLAQHSGLVTRLVDTGRMDAVAQAIDGRARKSLKDQLLDAANNGVTENKDDLSDRGKKAVGKLVDVAWGN